MTGVSQPNKMIQLSQYIHYSCSVQCSQLWRICTSWHTVVILWWRSNSTIVLVFLRVCLEGKRSSGEKCAASEDVMAFLSISFEENLVPALLVSQGYIAVCCAAKIILYLTAQG